MNTRIFIGVSVLTIFAFGGIYLLSTKSTSPNPVNEKVTIVTSFYPLEYLTERIVGDLAEVINIGQNSDPHGYTPSVKDLLTLESADLVLLQGAGLESWASDVERQLAAKNIEVYVMSDHITMYEGGEGETEVELEDEHSHEEESGHEGRDPHTWLDPVLALEMVLKLTEELVLIDPQHQANYEENATILISELRVIDLAYKNGLANCRVDEALVSHDALGYLSRRYNLTMHPIAGLSTEDEPSAKLLAELKQEAEAGVLGILTEGNAVSNYAETIARETGIMIIPFNALESDMMETKADYLTGMRTNLEALQLAYGCS